MRGALFFSLKDNVSYEETGTKYKRDREYAGLWVSGDSFCRFTAVYAEQAGDDRKCKIFVFPEYYAGAGGFCGAGCAVAEDPGRTDNETDVEENGCVYAVVSGVCNLFLWNQSLQGGCPFRCLSYNWDKLEETQGLLVGIYFAVSRYYDGSRSIWWIAGITAGIVTLIGLLNRLDIDVLGTFRGMENGEWNRTQLLSTIGNNNWYAGYISVTAGISLAAAFMGKRQVRVLGMIGSFLFFASAITSNSTTAILAACGLSLLLLLLSLRKRGRLLRALEILMLLPLSVFMVRMFLLLHLTGLVLAGDAEKRLFFTPAWYVVFVVEVAVYLILQLRERQERSDRLESGLAALLLGCLLVAGYLPGSDKVSEAANGRLALWKVTILTYGKEGLLFQIFGMGPDSFYYALYQWGSDAMDWINRGLLDNNIYSNAHNEWLTLLVQQGILGVIAYGGIFLTAFRNLRISATRDPRALAVFLGLTGYLICSLFTFQHVLSTPFAFALLGMAEGVLCKDVLNKS